MSKRSQGQLITSIHLNPRSSVPLFRQLYVGIRDAILTGKLGANTRLPSSRVLAEELDVSRNTVLSAYDQLLDEGYLRGRVGDGSYVSDVSPAILKPSKSQRIDPFRPVKGRVSRRGKNLISQPLAPDPTDPRPFSLGLPGLDEFPLPLWNRIATRRARRMEWKALGFGDPMGFLPLRKAIAHYLANARGISCEADQILISSSTQQSLNLCAKLLLDPGDSVWMEDPGYMSARGALAGSGANVVAVPVDQDGMKVPSETKSRFSPKLIYVTPSHQFPLGVTMSLQRRLELLEFAEANRAWILEDDYDSEFRFTGRPLQALQGLDHFGRVIYLGTFSKVLFPALRLAYLAIPPSLVDSFRRARMLVDGFPSFFSQSVLADFMEAGHLEPHIRAMREIYRERQEALLLEAEKRLSDVLSFPYTETGLHLAAWLNNRLSDQRLASEAATRGIDITPLSRYYFGEPKRSGFVFGYAGFRPAQIRTAIKTLVTTIIEFTTHKDHS